MGSESSAERTEAKVEFRDGDGDLLKYELNPAGNLSLSINGKMMLQTACWLEWDPAARRLHDETNESAPIPTAVDIDWIRQLSTKATSPACQWRERAPATATPPATAQAGAKEQAPATDPWFSAEHTVEEQL